MTTKQIKLSAKVLAYVSRERHKVVAEAPKTKECPKCHRKRAFQFFGVRTHKDPKTGLPARFSSQSYCVDCRSKKPASAKPKVKAASKRTPKVVAPKAAPKAKASPKVKTKKPPKTVLVTKPAEIPPAPPLDTTLATLPAGEAIVPATASLAMPPMPEVMPEPAKLRDGKPRKLVIVDK